MLEIINILFLLNTGRFQNRFQNVFHSQFLQIILSLTVGRADYSAYRQALLKFPVAITEVRRGVDRHLAEATARIRRDPWASKHLPKRESQICAVFFIHAPATVLLQPVSTDCRHLCTAHTVLHDREAGRIQACTQARQWGPWGSSSSGRRSFWLCPKKVRLKEEWMVCQPGYGSPFTPVAPRLPGPQLPSRHFTPVRTFLRFLFLILSRVTEVP